MPILPTCAPPCCAMANSLLEKGLISPSIPTQGAWLNGNHPNENRQRQRRSCARCWVRRSAIPHSLSARQSSREIAAKRPPDSYLSARTSGWRTQSPASCSFDTNGLGAPTPGPFHMRVPNIRKSRQGFPRRLVRCVFTWRCAASICNRTRCLILFGRTASIRRRVRCQCVGPTDPRSS